jgi:hypothetical protein
VSLATVRVCEILPASCFWVSCCYRCIALIDFSSTRLFEDTQDKIFLLYIGRCVRFLDLWWSGTFRATPHAVSIVPWTSARESCGRKYARTVSACLRSIVLSMQSRGTVVDDRHFRVSAQLNVPLCRHLHGIKELVGFEHICRYKGAWPRSTPYEKANAAISCILQHLLQIPLPARCPDYQDLTERIQGK